MSLKKARQFYQSLTQSQQHFVQKKLINDTMKVEQWLKFLSKAADYDAYTDTMESKYKKRFNTLIGFGVFLAFFGIFLLAFGLWYIYIIPITLITLAIMQRRAFKKMQEQDLHNTLRLLFIPLLNVLMVKSGPQAKMSANLNFRDPRKDLDPKKYKDGRGRNVK
ncbi:MAG TPA: hypothetical protein DCE41_30860, partial [Cytophagales bacterium]|nr:hypothetical protein [Cytophagales bacterium]